MTEDEWMACTDPGPMLDFLRDKATDRKLRLFAVACCRDIWDLIPTEASRKAVEASEEYADGRIRRKELVLTRERARQSESDLPQWAVMAASRPKVAPAWVAYLAIDARTWVGIQASYAPRRRASPQQCGHLRDIFGPLSFRPVTIDPSVLAWNDRTVPRLAQAIYERRRWRDMPILGDALLDAGCDNDEIVAHCRAGGEHVRGCWVVDLLLGRQ